MRRNVNKDVSKDSPVETLFNDPEISRPLIYSLQTLSKSSSLKIHPVENHTLFSGQIRECPLGLLNRAK